MKLGMLKLNLIFIIKTKINWLKIIFNFFLKKMGQMINLKKKNRHDFYNESQTPFAVLSEPKKNY